MPVYVFSRWRPSAILGLFLDHLRRPLDCLYFPANDIMTRSNVTEMLGFYDFAGLAGKRLFWPILDSFRLVKNST